MKQEERPVAPVDADATPPPVAPLARCRRCGALGPVGDDGFCDKCEQAMEQACL